MYSTSQTSHTAHNAANVHHMYTQNPSAYISMSKVNKGAPDLFLVLPCRLVRCAMLYLLARKKRAEGTHQHKNPGSRADDVIKSPDVCGSCLCRC